MVSFQSLFQSTNDFTIIYNGVEIFWCDRFPVIPNESETLILNIESTNSPYRQGVRIGITGRCKYQGKSYNKRKKVGLIFWEDTSPEEEEIEIFSESKYVVIQNIWEFVDKKTEKKIRESGVNGAAMIVEEIENGRRYRCNDGDPDDDFDDIVFTITRKKT